MMQGTSRKVEEKATNFEPLMVSCVFLNRLQQQCDVFNHSPINAICDYFIEGVVT